MENDGRQKNQTHKQSDDAKFILYGNWSRDKKQSARKMLGAGQENGLVKTPIIRIFISLLLLLRCCCCRQFVPNLWNVICIHHIYIYFLFVETVAIHFIHFIVLFYFFLQLNVCECKCLILFYFILSFLCNLFEVLTQVYVQY